MIQLLENEKEILRQDFNEFEIYLTDKRIIVGNSNEETFLDLENFGQTLYSAEKYQPLQKIKTYSYLLFFITFIGCGVGALADDPMLGEQLFYLYISCMLIWFLIAVANQVYLKDGIRFTIANKNGNMFFEHLMKESEREKFKSFYNNVQNQIYLLKEKQPEKI